ncbi:unnamed protein product [Rotaria sordida]|uniref:Band 7 domain-containing protein n=1 Tax=Rotaria sordida TaxID=392033 RepID=A0A815KUI4_9BILA|nr:unnamed protein product [Rotaria sordida]
MTTRSSPKDEAIIETHMHPTTKTVDITPTENNVDLCSRILIGLSYLLIFITFPISLCFCIRIVQEYERAVIFRLGRILPGGGKGPGLFCILPCVDTIIIIDLRTATFNVPPQEVLTRDSVTASVDAVVYSRVFNPVNIK